MGGVWVLGCVCVCSLSLMRVTMMYPGWLQGDGAVQYSLPSVWPSYWTMTYWTIRSIGPSSISSGEQTVVWWGDLVLFFFYFLLVVCSCWSGRHMEKKNNLSFIEIFILHLFWERLYNGYIYIQYQSLVLFHLSSVTVFTLVWYIMMQDGGEGLQLIFPPSHWCHNRLIQFGLTRLQPVTWHLRSLDRSKTMITTLQGASFAPGWNNGLSCHHGSGWSQRIMTKVLPSPCLMIDWSHHWTDYLHP